MIYESSLPSSTKKMNVVEVGPPLKKVSGSAHVSRRKNMKVKKENMPILLYSLQIFTSSDGIAFSVISQCGFKI